MRKFQDTFETRKQLFIISFLICMNLPLMTNLSLISRIYLWCSYTKMVNLSKDGISLYIANEEMVTNCTFFRWFNFSKYQGRYPNMSSYVLHHVHLYNTSETKPKGLWISRSLNQKTFASFFWLLTTTWRL